MRASEVAAGTVLRQARAQSGYSQRELAKRTGVTQSVIAAYESGTREPSLATLAALVEGTGYSLEVDLGAALPAEPSKGRIGHRLRRRRAAVLAIAAKYGVANVRVFGSVARGEDTQESDLDLLVDLPPDAGLLLIGRFKEDLEALLRVPVDVVPADGLKPRVRRNIDQDLVSL